MVMIFVVVVLYPDGGKKFAQHIIFCVFHICIHSFFGRCEPGKSKNYVFFNALSQLYLAGATQWVISYGITRRTTFSVLIGKSIHSFVPQNVRKPAHTEKVGKKQLYLSCQISLLF
jgi:hypothetical protein